MKIEDSFEVAAPIEETWRLLNDVPAVIPCMPGAELVEVKGDDEWLARLATKVGPIAMNFDTEVTRTETDEAGHTVGLAAKARELKGRGRANAKISSSLTALEQGTKVSIETELQMQGPLAQFGRGVVSEISAQMTRQFAENLAGALGGGAGPNGDSPATTSAPPAAKPINGLRLFFSALWRSFLGLFRRGGRR